MKKEEFLKILLETLKRRGVEDDVAIRETEHVRTYLTESGMEELDISADEMADGIIEMLQDPSDDDSRTVAAVAVAVPADNVQGSVSDELNAAIAAIDAEKNSPVDAESESNGTVQQESEAIPVIPIVLEPELEELLQNTDPEKSVPEVPQAPEEPQESVISEPPAENAQAEQPEESEERAQPEQPQEDKEPEAAAAAVHIDEPEPAPAEEPIPAPEAPKPSEVKEEKTEEKLPEPSSPVPPAAIDEDDEENAEIEEFIPYEKKKRMKKEPSETKTPNEWLYVLLLVVTIPLSIAIILIAFTLYLGFWVLLALLMIACIAVLIAFVTAGAVVSLVGIVFGVVELITGLVPVGLFEIGLGIIVGAAVMFVGILLYNFAVRFIPFGMKLLAKLFRSGFRAVRSGYQSLKGAVAKI